MRIGIHVSIAGGMKKAAARAVSLGCETMQIFSRSPRGGAARPLTEHDVQDMHRILQEADIRPLVVHAPYFLNAAAKEKATWRAAVEIISQELQRAATLQAAYLVIHCGHNEDAEQGLVRTQTAVMEAFTVADVSGVALLLENAAGMGNEIGFRFRELGALCHSLRKESLPVGLCLDSCHAFVADYDFTVPEGWQNMLNEVEEYCGWETVKLIHVNDAVGKAGSRFDRHAALGKGEIGGKGFKNLFSHPVLGQLPAVLETPRKSEQDDQENLEFLRRLRQEIRKGRHH